MCHASSGVPLSPLNYQIVSWLLVLILCFFTFTCYIFFWLIIWLMFRYTFAVFSSLLFFWLVFHSIVVFSSVFWSDVGDRYSFCSLFPTFCCCVVCVLFHNYFFILLFCALYIVLSWLPYSFWFIWVDFLLLCVNIVINFLSKS